MSTFVSCKDCGQEFSSRNQLFKHIRVEHEQPHKNITGPPAGIDIPKDVVVCFSDSCVLICNKPQGMTTQDQDDGPSLRRAPALLLKPEEILTESHFKKARPVHRIDKCTGGLVVCAKSKESRVSLSTSFENRLVSKRYMAMLAGKMEKVSGTIDIPIQGKDSVTDYEVLRVTKSLRYGHLTTVNLYPRTGRYHQLRRHMAYVGCPIVDDWRYSCQPLSSAESAQQTAIYLFAVQVTLPHPSQRDPLTEEPTLVEVSIPEPECFEALRRREEHACQEQEKIESTADNGCNIVTSPPSKELHDDSTNYI
jgi:23S rRNA-/tRNA-specific pseudouridylate synthase